MMENFLLRLAYDGTNYHGWQRQGDLPTIQGVLEDTYKKLTKKQIVIDGCSRTDSGVHAQDYVANFFSGVVIPDTNLPLALNSFLPDDIRVYSAVYVPEAFSSRFSAHSKTYCYTIDNGKIFNPLISRYAYHCSRKVDIALMKEAAEKLIGRHDFTAFAATGGTHNTPYRTISVLEVTKDDDIIKIRITANAYLYNMVRIIAGTLLHVGIGKISPGDILHIIESQDRINAGVTLPAKGLLLEKVKF